MVAKRFEELVIWQKSRDFTVINFRTQMTTSYAELGETCVATTAQLGIVIFFCCAYATAAFRPVMPISILRDARTSLDATLAKCRCVVARAEKRTLYHSAGVVDTRHFAKIRVSQSDLRSKINHHEAGQGALTECSYFGILSQKDGAFDED